MTTNGQPGCKTATQASPPTFTFPNLPANSTSTLALPYGTYRLSSGAATLTVAPMTDPLSGLLSSYTASVLTLDPRSGS